MKHKNAINTICYFASGVNTDKKITIVQNVYRILVNIQLNSLILRRLKKP